MDKIKRRHIRFKPQLPHKAIIYVEFKNTKNNSTITGYFEGIIQDISLGELSIVTLPNTLKKGDKIDVKIEKYGRINNCIIMRKEKNFLAVRFNMNPTYNDIILDFIQDNLENLKIGDNKNETSRKNV